MYDIYFDLHNMHQVVEDDEITGEDEFWHIGERFDYEFIEDEGPSIRRNDDYPVIVKRSRKNGCTCKACGEIYPYAEPNQKDGSFKCWSCRNF
jgi:hypothetical protein